MTNYFKFKGNVYYNGTVVKIYDDKTNKFNFSRYLKFSQFDKDENKYKFHYLNNCLEKYSLSEDELEIYIESIVTACVQSLPNEIKVEPKYIDGIVVAWTWYILIMFGSLFVKGIAIKILLQIVTTCFFVLWRKKKMRGE